MNKVLAAVLFLALVTGCIGGVRLSDTSTSTTSTIPTSTTTGPYVRVSDNGLGTTAVVDEASANVPSYVVIHLVEEGNVSRVVGHSGLFNGHVKNLEIPVSGFELPATLAAMMHFDDGDGVYEFPGPDEPLKHEGETVAQRFRFSDPGDTTCIECLPGYLGGGCTRVGSDTIVQPRQCIPYSNSLAKVGCDPSQRGMRACTRIYDPVCASDAKTYSNPCMACINYHVEYYVHGRCEDVKEVKGDIRSATTTTVAGDTPCGRACVEKGYLGGECRINGFECKRRNEIEQPDRMRLCTQSNRYDTCCCQNENSVEVTSFFVYNKGAYDGDPSAR